MRSFRIAMAQINTTVGDFDGNVKKILAAVDNACTLKADIVTFPELAICGYPPEDLLFKPQFLQANLQSLQRIIEASACITIVVGFVDSDGDIRELPCAKSTGRLDAPKTNLRRFIPAVSAAGMNRF